VLSLVVCACGGEPTPAAPTPAPPSFVRIDIPRASSVEYMLERPGDTVQLHAVASFSDGSTTDVTGEAAWTIAGPSVVSVARGLVTGLADGGTTVQATYRGWSTITNVRVGVLPSQRRSPVSGVVRDAEQGTPVIERTLSGTLAPPPAGFEESRTSIRITTRAGGIFDAVVQPASCTGSSGLRIFAESGGREFAGSWGTGCTSRIRFVVPAPDVALTIVGFRATDWMLTFREPL
jgi:hypothetical protein